MRHEEFERAQRHFVAPGRRDGLLRSLEGVEGVGPRKGADLVRIERSDRHHGGGLAGKARCAVGVETGEQFWNRVFPSSTMDVACAGDDRYLRDNALDALVDGGDDENMTAG